MSDLHPAARALIEAAKRGETPLSGPARARVHRSVARKAAAYGAALASTTAASAAAKVGVLAVLMASPLVAAGVVGALGTAALVLVHSASLTPTPPHAIVRAAAGQPISRSPDGATTPANERRPVLPGNAALPSPSGASPASPAPAVSLLTPRSSFIATGSASASVAAARPSKSVASPATQASAGPDPAGPAGESVAPPYGASSIAVVATATEEQPVGGSEELSRALDVVRRARAALRAGRPEEALELLRGSAVSFEAGPFAEEAQAARTSALCQSGRTQEARTAIEQLRSAWPNSPLATRLREGCAALRGAGAVPSK